jgi:hypothetical protein
MSRIEPPAPPFEADLRSHRQLDSLLVGVDLLQRWALYGRAFYAARGLPLPTATLCPPRAEWPQPVIAIYDAVRELHFALASAAIAHYWVGRRREEGGLDGDLQHRHHACGIGSDCLTSVS